MIAELLAVAALTGPAGESACAVTQSANPVRRHGGRALWTHLRPDGVVLATRRTDGSLGTKLGWSARREYRGGLTVSGRRLDATAAPMTVLAVRWGHSSAGDAGWATAVTFPSAGCWRITGRSAGARLSYVVRVVQS